MEKMSCFPAWLKLSGSPSFSPSGAHSLKSSRTSAVRMARVVAVAQSKLTFVKSVQTGMRRLCLKTNFRLYSSRDEFYLFLSRLFLSPPVSHSKTPNAIRCQEHVL